VRFFQRQGAPVSSRAEHAVSTSAPPAPPSPVNAPDTGGTNENRAIPQIDQLAEHLEHCVAADNPPKFDSRDDKLWILALDALIARGAVEAAKHALIWMNESFPNTKYFQRMNVVLSRLPPVSVDRNFAAFRDDRSKDIQVVRRAGADVVLIGLCGAQHQMMIPVNLIHRWFGQANVHVIYLRDFSSRLYSHGVSSISGGYQATIDQLLVSARELGATRIVCQGHSSGGFGAMKMALDLGAEATLTFGAPTCMIPLKDEQQRYDQFSGGVTTNLRVLYDAALQTPRAHLIFAGLHERDVRQATNMAGLPKVTLEAMPDQDHHGSVFLQVLEMGRYETLLNWLVDPSRCAGIP
jgi:hypothetical protein